MSAGYRQPPGARVFDAAPLVAWIAEEHPGRPIKGPRGLAAATGVSEVTIRRLLRGHTETIRETTADRILNGLDARLEDVYRDEAPAFQRDRRAVPA